MQNCINLNKNVQIVIKIRIFSILNVFIDINILFNYDIV